MNLPDVIDIKTMVQKALEKLEIAKLVYSKNYFDDSIARAYYAIFHLINAVLFTQGLSFSSHRQTLGAFNREYIQKKIFPEDYAKKLDLLFKNRQIGDYEIKSTITKEVADKMFEYTEEIIKQCLNYLSELYQVKDNFWKQ